MRDKNMAGKPIKAKAYKKKINLRKL